MPIKVKVFRVNAFTDSIDGGNPAGVLLDTPDLTDKQMANITKQMKVSETAFVSSSEKANIKNVFFTPKLEVELCGHGTIATFFTMAKLGFFKGKDRISVTQETKAGILPVEIYFSDGGIVKKVMMHQAKPILKDIYLNIFEVADSLNISTNVIDDSLPKQIVSTGLFTLPLCINTFEDLKVINPDFNKIKSLCNKLGVGSFILFTFDTLENDSTYHARVFCPLYAINEDPTTGTANGALSYYLIKNNIIKKRNIKCEQGDIIGRPGRIYVEISYDNVKVGGVAIIVEEIELEV
jgi:PhzF family phenazine biosynthesis protein